MIFWCPEIQRFNTSADYTLDVNKDLKDLFPGLIYDGCLDVLPLHEGSHPALPHSINSVVHFQIPGGNAEDVASGTVVALPIPSQCEFYQVQLDDGSTINLFPEEIWSSSEAMGGNQHVDKTQGDPTQKILLPDWLTHDLKVTLEHDGSLLHGHMCLLDTGQWGFVQKDRRGRPINVVLAHDLGSNWRDLHDEGTVELGWTDFVSKSRHVSAKELKHPCPGFLWKALSNPNNSDYETWLAAYTEEHEGLRSLDTYTVIDKATVERLGVTPIPTMNILNIKPDSQGNPLRAKSRTAVLGNEEERCWEKSDVYAPVMSKAGARSFVANGVSIGRITKQADAKNAFCHSYLPKDEVAVVIPPKGCPYSKPGDYWLLNKTLYGLRRSPYHWFQTLKKGLEAIGLKACEHDPCIYVGTAPNGAKLYVGTCVDDIIYYGENDDSERWFEQQLKQHIKVDFMGAVSWHLGVYYEWSRTTDGRLTVHLSQEAMVHKLLTKEGMEDCTDTKSTPHRSGLPIDRIPHDGVPPENKLTMVRRCQSIMGGLVWLSTQSRPDTSAAVSLLCTHSHNPSEGHTDAARHVLKCLKGSSDWGIRYTTPQPDTEDLSESRLRGEVMWPVEGKPHVQSRQFTTHTDAGWGPQDASKPKAGETRQDDECKSLAGAVTLFMGGPIDWTVLREKRMSRSSCEAEIKAMDEGCKMLEFLQHLFREMEIPDSECPAPMLYNDNKGGVQWSLSEAITKRLRHLNIREVAIRDAVRFGDVILGHIPGPINLADIFTKEMSDVGHFLDLRSALVCPRVAAAA